MEPTFKLVALGIQANRNLQTVRQQLFNFFQGGPAEIDALIERMLAAQYVVIAENLPRKTAENLARMLDEAGLQCRVDPLQLTLEPLERPVANYQCPACGHTQPVRAGNPDTCERCGVIGDHYQTYAERKEALEREWQRVQGLVAQRGRSRTGAFKEKISKQQQRIELELLSLAIRRAEGNSNFNFPLSLGLRAFFGPRWLPILLGICVLVIAVVGIDFLYEKFSQGDQPAISQEKGKSSFDFTIDLPASNPSDAPTAISQPASQPAGRASSSDAAPAVTKPPKPSPVAPVRAPAARIEEAAKNLLPPKTSTENPTSSPTISQVPGRGEQLIPGAATTTVAEHRGPFIEPSQFSPPVAASDVTPVAKVTVPDDPRLLVALARYQIAAGDMADAQHKLARAAELLDDRSINLSVKEQDVINRERIEAILAAAVQYQQITDVQEQWLQAIRLTNLLTSSSERALAFASLARSLQTSNAAAAGDYFRRAGENARTVSDPNVRITVLSALARDLAATRRVDQAGAIFAQVKAMSADLWRSTEGLIALSRTAQHLAEAGAVNAAESLLEEIEQTKVAVPPSVLIQYQLQARSALAQALTANGDGAAAQSQFTKAFGTAASLSNLAVRESALLYLARVLAQAGDKDSAERVVAEALRHRTGPASPDTR